MVMLSNYKGQNKQLLQYFGEITLYWDTRRCWWRSVLQEYFIFLFSLYTNPISSIIHSHSSINYHFYTQLYITISPQLISLTQILKNCLNNIQNFMLTNQLNPDKIEFILIGSKYNHKQLFPYFPINILGNQVSPAQRVRNLRVVLDSNYTLSDHVPQVIKSTRVHSRDLYRICPLLDLKTSVVLANALVSSRLDYCNSLFISLGTPIVLSIYACNFNSLLIS